MLCSALFPSHSALNLQSEDLDLGSNPLWAVLLPLLESVSSPTLLNGDQTMAGPAFSQEFWKEHVQQYK